MNLKKMLMLSFLLFGPQFIIGQVDPQVQLYRDEPKGNYQYRREGTMDGNLIRTLYYNNGEVGQYPFEPSGEWPKGSGHSYLDGVTVLIGAKVTLPGGKTITPIEASYREEMDKDPITGEIWGLEPVPGYLNASQKKPAINKDKSTFPTTWPAALGLNSAWDGYWYGYFGRGVTNADFETFFVLDDSRDKEFTRAPFYYFPIAADSDRGGLGLRVEVRGFQWSHVLAEDIIFWHYDIVNISDHDYDSTSFGFYSDAGVGGTNNYGNSALFDRKQAIAYAWAPSGKGVPGDWKTGYYGYAYLESPGNATDGIDNDFDGMIDERRDNNIDDDHDWVGYTDLNGNGKWDESEPLNNDVGRDGVGPFDPQYNGPDAGEGDGVPTHGEPNYEETDKDESDQIGLTAESIYILSGKGPTDGWPKNDDVMWKKMNSGFVDTLVQNTNISMVFASGPFPLKKAKRERFSMALIFGNDLDDLLFNKETVQQIYNANYNFSKPPLTPTLTAVAGNKKVFLYWDKVAEQSRDPFLGFQDNDPKKGYKKDFEGYLIYRSGEAEFNDIKTITDSKGEAKYWKPIAQFDLADTISGPDPVGINGAHFWRGDNTGLQHSYVDTTVKNGQRYYYAVVSYDMGDKNFGTSGLQPTECTKIITEDYAGSLKFADINCAVITPNAPAAGYIPPELKGDLKKVTNGIGTGSLSAEILNPAVLANGTEYRVSFNSEGAYPNYHTVSYDIIKIAGGVTDTLEKAVDTSNVGASKFTAPFGGITVAITNDTAITVIDTATNWLVGKSNLTMQVLADNSNVARDFAWPADYKMEFFGSNVTTTPFTKIPLNFIVTNTTTGDTVKAELFDNDNSGGLSVGDDIVFVQYIGSVYKLTWRVEYHAPLWPGVTAVEPMAGDKFIISTSKPFKSGDYFSFTTKAAASNNAVAKTQLSAVSVVPNPYICSAAWERRTLNQTGRGERKIDFINLPAKCTLRIYTMSGYLVKTLTKDSTPNDGSLSWNLVTEDGMDIAYGIYIYHIDAPGIGEQIGKFAVIK